MALLPGRRRGLRGAMDKLRRATRRFMAFCDQTIGVRDDDGGKAVMRELRRFLTRDVPRYFKRLPVPYSYSDAQRLTLREWLHLLPLLIVVVVLAQRSVYALFGVVFLITLVNA